MSELQDQQPRQERTARTEIDERLNRGRAAMMILALSALSWAVLISIGLAVYAVV